MEPKPITGLEPKLTKALLDANIIPKHCKRVVIDIALDEVVTIYYECHGDERLLDINFDVLVKEAIERKENLNGSRT